MFGYSPGGLKTTDLWGNFVKFPQTPSNSKNYWRKSWEGLGTLLQKGSQVTLIPLPSQPSLQLRQDLLGNISNRFLQVGGVGDYELKHQMLDR